MLCQKGQKIMLCQNGQKKYIRIQLVAMLCMSKVSKEAQNKLYGL